MSNSPDRYYKDENGISHRVYEYYCRDCGHRYRTDYYEVTENCTVTTFYDYLLLENGEYVFKYKENLGCYTYHSEDWVETTNGNSFTRSYACSDCGTALIATTVNAVMPDDVTLSFAENDFSRPLFEFTVSRSGKYLLYSSSVVDETYLDTIIVIKDENGNRLNEADGGADNGHFSTSFVFEEGITYYLEIGTYSSDGIDTFNFFVEYAN